jgi:lipopolysaccharide transport protein LptA
VTFTAYGLDYLADHPEHLRLLQRVEVISRSVRDLKILSDSADYSENLGRLAFNMSEKRPVQEQFVRLVEPAFELKARNLELDISGEKELQTVRAEQDVWFEESGENGRKTSGTGGRGTYSVESGLVTLSEFPQLYQDRDTITGDIILFHRDSDTIEVRQSNASYGN